MIYLGQAGGQQQVKDWAEQTLVLFLGTQLLGPKGRGLKAWPTQLSNCQFCANEP